MSIPFTIEMELIIIMVILNPILSYIRPNKGPIALLIKEVSINTIDISSPPIFLSFPWSIVPKLNPTVNINPCKKLVNKNINNKL